MNLDDFGKLVASLRKEHEDEEDIPWTQGKLAEEANLAAGAEIFSADIISSIERGKRSLDEETLLALATALQLTSGERKEFFLAASGIDNERIARQDNDPEEVLTNLLSTIRQAYLPAYVIDSYCDVVGVNSAILRILDLEAAGLDRTALAARPFGSNVLQYVYLDEAVEHFSQLMGRDWSSYANHHMLLFRTLSLRYRSTDYFQGLLKELKKSRLFKRYWREVYFTEQDHFIDNEHIHLNSPKWGPLVWFSTSLTALTTAGELYFCVYVPSTADTARVFSEIVQEPGASDTYRVGSWPVKTLPEGI
jgi:hypothetical protein